MKRNATVAFQRSDTVQGILLCAENKSHFALVKCLASRVYTRFNNGEAVSFLLKVMVTLDL